MNFSARLSSSLRKSTVLRVCVALCVLNILLVTGLAVTGVLKTVQPGDVTYTRTDPGSGGDITLSGGSDDRFVIERPTDVDAFYNMVIRVTNSLPMYNPYGGGSGAGEWHYSPLLFFLFAPMTVFGYVWFKVIWLAMSVLMTVAGTYLLLRAELEHRSLDVSRGVVLGLSAASIGFAPMVTNFKSGHPTPMMYLAIAATWWLVRTDRNGHGGLAMLVPMLTKPYMTTPLVLFASRRRYRGLLAFVGGVVGSIVFTVVLFGTEPLFSYFSLLYGTAFSDVAGGGVTLSFDSWYSNTMHTHYIFGAFGVVLRLAAVGILGMASLQYLKGRDSRPLRLFSLSLVAIFFLIRSYSYVDVAILLAVFVTVGVNLYASDSTLFFPLALSYLLTMGHPYFLELTVGYGVTVFEFLASNETLVMAVIPYLQPAVYGLFILAGIVLTPYWQSLGSALKHYDLTD